jgi:hypothetical protein
MVALPLLPVQIDCRGEEWKEKRMRVGRAMTLVSLRSGLRVEATRENDRLMGDGSDAKSHASKDIVLQNGNGQGQL